MGCVDGNVRLDGRELISRSAIQPGHRPLERHLNARHLAIVAVVHARYHSTDGRVRKPHEPDEQPGFHIEAQRSGPAIRGRSLHNVRVPIVDERREAGAPVVNACLIRAGKDTSDSSLTPSRSWPVMASTGTGFSVAGAAIQAERPSNVQVVSPERECAMIVRWPGALAYISSGLLSASSNPT